MNDEKKPRTKHSEVLEYNRESVGYWLGYLDSEKRVKLGSKYWSKQVLFMGWNSEWVVGFMGFRWSRIQAVEPGFGAGQQGLKENEQVLLGIKQQSK